MDSTPEQYCEPLFIFLNPTDVRMYTLDILTGLHGSYNRQDLLYYIHITNKSQNCYVFAQNH